MDRFQADSLQQATPSTERPAGIRRVFLWTVGYMEFGQSRSGFQRLQLIPQTVDLINRVVMDRAHPQEAAL